MELFCPLRKYDEAAGTVYGVMTAEEADKQGEIFDYAGGGRDAVQAWSDDFVTRTRAAGQAVSLGNLRLQHRADTIAGKAIRIDFDDNSRSIGLLAELTPEARSLAQNGMVTGYSIAGDFESRNCKECGADMMGEGRFCPDCGKSVLVRFVPRIVEVSVVDNPCVPSATFEYVKATGQVLIKSFHQGESLMKKYLASKIEHHAKLAKLHQSLAEHHAKLAKGAEQRADFTAQHAQLGIAEAHQAIARHHKSHVGELSEMRNNAPDSWPLAELNTDTDGHATDKAVHGFFENFLYKGTLPGKSANYDSML